MVPSRLTGPDVHTNSSPDCMGACALLAPAVAKQKIQMSRTRLLDFMKELSQLGCLDLRAQSRRPQTGNGVRMPENSKRAEELNAVCEALTWITCECG